VVVVVVVVVGEVEEAVEIEEEVEAEVVGIGGVVVVGSEAGDGGFKRVSCGSRRLQCIVPYGQYTIFIFVLLVTLIVYL